MFGQPKDDLQKELEGYDKGEKNDVFEDFNENADIQLQQYSSNVSQESFYSKSQLMPGEQVIWQGKASAKDPGIIFLKLFGIFWLGFSLLWTFLAAMGSILFAAFGIPFIIIGIMLLKGKKNGEYHIITNKRILICSKGSRSVYYEQITDLSYEINQSGMGYISYVAANGMSSGTIYGVPNTEQVYNAMCQAIREVQG